MRCRSLAGIWPETPPSHRVTATAVINHPPSLFTGAADGSIVWWQLSGDLSSNSKKIKPVAMLCGHTAPIVDLCISYLLLASSDENVDHSKDVEVNSNPGDQGALVSACSDGVLCVWSIGSGHCKRNRKLPPWVGTPSMVQTSPANRRYVYVASCFTDTFNASDHDYMDSGEGSELTGDQESSGRKPPKCTIVIVDSYTLTIVQTVFHGNLSIRTLKFMALVESVDDKQKEFALMIDSYGKIQCISLVKDSDLHEGGNKLLDNSSVENTATLGTGSYEGGLVISVATCGQMLGLVYKTRCVFMLFPSAIIIGVISLENNALCSGADCHLSRVSGGMFISSDNTCTSNSGKVHDKIDAKFAVWNDRGYAVIYKMSYADKTFEFEVIHEIPAISFPMDVKLSTNFVQLSNYFLRVESLCFHYEEPFLWKPHITIWALGQQVDDDVNFGKTCSLLGEGDFLVNWDYGSSFASKSEASEHALYDERASIEAASRDSSLEYTLGKKGRSVTSTMVISLNAHTPYAFVYGYHNGEIELVQLEILSQELHSDGVNLHAEGPPRGLRQQFSGHTGAVLCLAAHQMVGTSAKQTYSQVLMSGSMDCTLRIWDLETCNPIIVMHHHVAPVRQIILPPLHSDHPWSDCFLSVGEDSCVSLVSLGTLRVERMFPGHLSCPTKVVWDTVRGYLACLSQNHTVASGPKDALYIWDVKAGSRERVLRGTAAHSMFNNFCKAMSNNKISGYLSDYNTSSSSLVLLTEDGSSLPAHLQTEKCILTGGTNPVEHNMSLLNSTRGRSVKQSPRHHDKIPFRCFSPISGMSVLSFDLSFLTSPDVLGDDGGKPCNGPADDLQTVKTSSQQGPVSDYTSEQGNYGDTMERDRSVNAVRLCLLRFSLSFLHMWGVDFELDNLLMTEMNVKKYENLMLAPGVEGDRGSITLAFPDFSSTLQLWKSSSEFCALRSLIMLSLAQNMVSLSHSCSGASSALSAFYTRNFAEKIPDVKPPSLQLLVSFWQDEDEHVRMAARSLFHCTASRAIPVALCCPRTTELPKTVNCVDHMRGSLSPPEIQGASQNGESEILKWLESYELQDWISCVNGSSQDAMASRIIVAAALAIWYPSLVKPNLAMLVVHPLMKLVMAMNEKYSCTAVELLAEGMDCTWKACIGSEIPRLIGDIFFQIECVSSASANTSSGGAIVSPKLRETLVGVLLPSLALADIPGFLSVIEGLIWSTASDSPVHLVSLKTLIRLMRGSPRNLAPYLNKVVNFILQTLDPANLVMRKTCLQSSMATLREVVRVYPMVALNDTSTRLAVGDAITEVNCANIHVYDMQSVTKIKILDASGPPGLPTLLVGAEETLVTGISALSFSPNGEGIVAFSEHGLIIRWWSLGTAWWDKLSRNFIPAQCTKLILVPPWEGFSPNSSRASLMANIVGNGRQPDSQEQMRLSDVDSLSLLLYNLDLSYRLQWAGDRKVLLTRHGQELENFLL